MSSHDAYNFVNLYEQQLGLYHPFHSPYSLQSSSSFPSSSSSSVPFLSSPSSYAPSSSTNIILPTLPEHDPPSSLSSLPKPSESYGGEPEIPHFEYFSYDKIQDLYEQRKGHFYFIPEGFEPVLVPNDSQAETVANLLENSRPVSTVPNVPRMLPDTDICLPSFALPCGVNGQKKDNSSKNGKNKKPPRPPNAFILYRRLKQPSIVASHQGITNNEVSKEIGKMWHEESMEERNKFQKMAEAAKEEHMRKYPEYRYRPRRPQERKRRGQATTKKQTAQQKQQQSQQLQTSLLSSQHPNPEIEEITTPQNASPSLQQMSYTHSPETFCAQSPEPDETITPPHSSPQQIPYTQSPENTLHNTFNINEVKPFVNDFTFNVDDMYYNSISQQFPDTPNYGFGYATYN